MLSYDGLKMGRIYYKHTARESFDCEYKEALEAYRKRVEQESINVLYVAFTRAKYGLSIAPRKSKSTKQDSQKNNSSFAKLELESVCDDLPQLSSIIHQDQLIFFSHCNILGVRVHLLDKKKSKNIESLRVISGIMLSLERLCIACLKCT